MQTIDHCLPDYSMHINYSNFKNLEMKINFFTIALLLLSLSFTAVSCDKEEDVDPITVTIDSSQPQGDFTVTRMGTFTAQNDAPTAGTAEFGTDAEGTNFLRFGSDFTTQLATGTVSVYLSTSDTFTADPGNGNPDLKLVGSISANGAQAFKLNAAPAATFTHVILWCNTASVPFGNAAL